MFCVFLKRQGTIGNNNLCFCINTTFILYRKEYNKCIKIKPALAVGAKEGTKKYKTAPVIKKCGGRGAGHTDI